jgi:hypothetical protein
VLKVLESNTQIKAFDNYEPLWEEEREDINEAYCLRTEFDFVEANRAVQKTLKQMGDSESTADQGISYQQNDNFDDWDDQPKKKTTQKKQVVV